ncbi:SCO family protein [Burkholderiaceae bacterium UC74_6]
MSGSNSSSDPKRDPLELTVHSLPEPSLAFRKKRGRWQMLLVVAVCAAPVIASYFSFYVLRLTGKPNGELIEPPAELPAQLTLSDLQGKPVDAASLKGQWLLTLVQDGSCPKTCEELLFEQRQLREMLGKERDKVDKLWLIPDDAAPRPDLLAALMQGVPPTVLRAPRAQIEAWLHPVNGTFALIDPQGRFMLRTKPAAEPKAIKQDLDRLLKANAGWDRAGR